MLIAIIVHKNIIYKYHIMIAHFGDSIQCNCDLRVITLCDNNIYSNIKLIHKNLCNDTSCLIYWYGTKYSA